MSLSRVLVFVDHSHLLTLCFRFDASNELGTIMRTEFLCIFVLSEASAPRM